MNRFEQLRVERGLTQVAVAAGAGVSRGTIVRLEGAADPWPTAPVAKRLADFYGISVSQLLGTEALPADQSEAS